MPNAFSTDDLVTRRYRPSRRTGTGNPPSRARRYAWSRPRPNARPAVRTSTVAGQARISSTCAERPLTATPPCLATRDGQRRATPSRSVSVRSSPGTDVAAPGHSLGVLLGGKAGQRSRPTGVTVGPHRQRSTRRATADLNDPGLSPHVPGLGLPGSGCVEAHDDSSRFEQARARRSIR